MSQFHSEAYVRKNLGPQWGPDLLLLLDRILPSRVLNFFVLCACYFCVPLLKSQTKVSTDWLWRIRGKKPHHSEIARHYYHFILSLLELLRMSKNTRHVFNCVGANAKHFQDFLKSGKPALFGTFHIGNSDLLGYALGERGHKIGMIRMNSGNSAETRRLVARFQENVKIVWVDKPENIFFEIKRILQSGESLAMKCDRLEFSSKGELFYFAGRQYEFPFTIYHLAILFNLPLWFCVGVPSGKGITDVYPFSVFVPDVLDKGTSLRKGKIHFQSVLNDIEEILKENPYLWFNFLLPNKY